jgi:hypothetical protein
MNLYALGDGIQFTPPYSLTCCREGTHALHLQKRAMRAAVLNGRGILTR